MTQLTRESTHQNEECPCEVEFSLAVSLAGNNRLTTSFMGPVQKGERGAEYAAKAVVFAFNENSPGWSEPRRLGDSSATEPLDRRERGADFETVRGFERVLFQVTRVPADSSFYHEAHVQGHATLQRSISELADDLLDAIQRKGKRLASPQTVTLVLDASRALGYDWGPVLENFRQRNAPEALGYGFEDIVLVGTDRVVRLLGAAHPAP